MGRGQMSRGVGSTFLQRWRPRIYLIISDMLDNIGDTVFGNSSPSQPYVHRVASAVRSVAIFVRGQCPFIATIFLHEKSISVGEGAGEEGGAWAGWGG